MFNETQPDLSDQPASNLAAICEQARIHGAAPEPGEPDPREIWDRESALDAVSAAFRTLVDHAGPTGFQLADELESLLWSYVNMFDAQVKRLDKSIDKLMPDLRDLQKEQDGSEIKAHELEDTTHRVRNLTSRRDAFEEMRDHASCLYLEEAGHMWRPWSGSHTSLTGALTSAAIDARDFVRARKDRETKAHLPAGTLIAVSGGADGDPDLVFATLDKARHKYCDMVLVHGGGSGVEKFAARWAERHGVDQVVCRPDWNAFGRAAPFRRNDELLNLLPKGLIVFPGGSGIVENLADKAASLGIPVMRVQG